MILQHFDTLIAFATVMLGVSLIITILTQLISALLGLRGANLRWGIQTLLTTANSKFGKESKIIAQALLNHALISDSTFSRFEGWKGFKTLIARFKLTNGIRKEEIIRLLGTLELPANTGSAATLKDNLEEIKNHIEKWFDSVMDRVSQRFAMSTRMWTVSLAILLAMVLHLDAVALLRRLSQDQATRARLVASADVVVRETSRAVGATGETNAYVAAIQQLKQGEPDISKWLTNTPASINSPEAANFWLRNQLRAYPQAQQALARFHELTASNVLERAPELMGSVAIVNDELARAGLVLFPDFKAIQLKDYSPLRLSFWGMLVSAGLLSLGAPFWYNGLKTLTNLRPVLATRMKEQESTKSPK